MPPISGPSFPHSRTETPPDPLNPTQIKYFGCKKISAIAQVFPEMPR